MAHAPEQAGAPAEGPITSASPTGWNGLVCQNRARVVGGWLKSCSPAPPGPGLGPGAFSFTASVGTGGGLWLCDSEVVPQANCAEQSREDREAWGQSGHWVRAHTDPSKPVPVLSGLPGRGRVQGTVPLWAEGARKAGSKYTIEPEGLSPSAQKHLQLPVLVCALLGRWACRGWSWLLCPE